MKILPTSTVLALSAALVCASPAEALYNKDLKKLPGKELGTYIIGNVEMLIFSRYQMGDKSGSSCIQQWYYKNDKTPVVIHEAIKRYPDNTPQAVIFALARKACFPK